MFKHRLTSAAAAILMGMLLAATPAFAQALKTAGACNDEYKVNKPALKAAKEKKGDFITACRALPVGTPTPIGAAAPSPSPAPSSVPAPSRTATVSGLKTAGACNDEYKANKGALKDAKEKKKDFIAACRALPPGTPTPINGGAAPVPAPSTPAPAPAPQQTPAPSQAPAPAPTTTNRAPAPSAPSAPTGANEFSTEGAAKTRCPSATVVWVNTKSGIYHFAGTKNYGNTKAGAYMCETDATAAGDRASKTEKHP